MSVQELFDECGYAPVYRRANDPGAIGAQPNTHDIDRQRALIDVDEVTLTMIETHGLGGPDARDAARVVRVGQEVILHGADHR